MNKLFVPVIYLYRGNSVKGMEDLTILSSNPVELAERYQDYPIDELFLFDLSDTEEEKQQNFAVIEQILHDSEVPVNVFLNLMTYSDAVRLLTEGCSRICIDFRAYGVQAALFEMALDLSAQIAEQFGREKVIGIVSRTEVYTEYCQQIDASVYELLLMDSRLITECIATINMPFLLFLSELPLDKLLEYLGIFSIAGITGNFVNSNLTEVGALKHLCSENAIDVNTNENTIPWSKFKLNSDGMIPVVTQDYKTGEVLMVAYMTKEAYEMTLRTGIMTYYSRSRHELWIKGDTSGHYQYVKSLTADCDMDTLLAGVKQIGAACHTGSYSCFFNEIIKKM